jgi:glycosyltransferase involved in cell wall biosynthesis
MILLGILLGVDRGRIAPQLLCDQPVLRDRALEAGIETTVFPIPRIMVDGGEASLPFRQCGRLLAELLSLIRRGHIDLLYCSGGRPCQVGYYAAKLARIPIVCHVMCPYERRYILLYRLHRASKVIFVGQAIQDQARNKQRFRAPSEVIYPGVDTDRFEPPPERNPRWREELALPHDALVVGQVSSLIHRKGIDILLRAFQIVAQQLQQARLVLVGDGPQREHYLALARDLGVRHRVAFVGDQADPLRFYQHVFDVNVLASRSEALAVALLEAAACGLPTVASTVDGSPEVVRHRRTGLLFPVGDHAALADRILQLAGDPGLRSRLGLAARQQAVERFSKQAFLQSIERVILEQAQVGEGSRREAHAFVPGVAQ